jgi:hypothetical protein
VITELDLQRAASDLIGRDYAFQNDILPLAFQDGVLILGVEPEKATIDEKAALRVRFKQLVELRSMAIESIRAGLHELYEAPRSAPAAGTVEALFYDLFAASLAARAHDLIIEPIEYGRDNQVHAVVRHHVDGVHRDASMLSPEVSTYGRSKIERSIVAMAPTALMSGFSMCASACYRWPSVPAFPFAFSNVWNTYRRQRALGCAVARSR